MRRIIQIDESEYNELVEKANLNEKQIEEKALAMYNKRGAAQVEITVRTNDSTYSKRYFKCDSFVWYKDNRFFISEKLRNRLEKYISEYVSYKVNQDYEKPQKLMLRYERELHSLKIAQYIFYIIAASGWGAFVALLFMK